MRIWVHAILRSSHVPLINDLLFKSPCKMEFKAYADLCQKDWMSQRKSIETFPSLEKVKSYFLFFDQTRFFGCRYKKLQIAWVLIVCLAMWR